VNNPCSTSHPFAVWEQTGTGHVLRFFADEYLAMQFAVSVSGQVIDNPINH
jgi:hypothetical protein